MDNEAKQLGDRFREALRVRGLKQATLARQLGMGAPQLSRYLNGHAPWTLELASRFDKVLGGTELVDAMNWMRQRYDIYLAAPITGIEEEHIPRTHEAISRLFDLLSEEGYHVYWPGRAITSIEQLIAPSVATALNVRSIANSQALVYVQFQEVVHPSGALVELGIALGRKMRTTVIALQGLRLPFMLSNGFDGVANSSDELPDAKVHVFSSTDDAIRQIKNTGPAFFGLRELVQNP